MGRMLSNARNLRKNMTKEERHLWYDFLRDYPEHIYKQRIIGKYVVDFYCATAQLVIELDGSQHYEENHHAKDFVRDANMKENGYTILRYSNADIQYRFRGVCEDILNHIGQIHTDSP